MYRLMINGRCVLAGLTLTAAVSMADARATCHNVATVSRADSSDVCHVGRVSFDSITAL